MCSIAVVAVLTDGLAPLGVRIHAATVIAKICSHAYIYIYILHIYTQGWDLKEWYKLNIVYWLHNPEADVDVIHHTRHALNITLAIEYKVMSSPSWLRCWQWYYQMELQIYIYIYIFNEDTDIWKSFPLDKMTVAVFQQVWKSRESKDLTQGIDFEKPTAALLTFCIIYLSDQHLPTREIANRKGLLWDFIIKPNVKAPLTFIRSCHIKHPYTNLLIASETMMGIFVTLQSLMCVLMAYNQ